MELEALLKQALFRRAMGLSLTDRELRALFKTVEEVFMAEQKTQDVATFEDAVDAVLADLRAVMVSKQRDYGPRNILNCGVKGVAVRANDKMARLLNLYGISDGSFLTKEAKNESIEDSWVDLANYGIIALMLTRGTFERPLKR